MVRTCQNRDNDPMQTRMRHAAMQIVRCRRKTGASQGFDALVSRFIEATTLGGTGVGVDAPGGMPCWDNRCCCDHSYFAATILGNGVGVHFLPHSCDHGRGRGQEYIGSQGNELLYRGSRAILCPRYPNDNPSGCFAPSLHPSA